ncbi:MAG: leucine-rich repeat domain-containing protein [Phycisphaerae bacterium]|nr:leucine-rich repeat domain-containing protein [Phycisphaerae bacterium]
MNAKEVLKEIERAARENETSLDLSCEGLTSLPPEIGRLTNLTELFLDNNQLTSVPAELGQLTHLTQLWLSGNQLTSVPVELGLLTDLRELYLDNNKLTSIPPELGQLTNLVHLFLDNNQLTSVPKELGWLTALVLLSLYNNQLTSILKELAQLPSLTSLHLSNNQLTSVPAELGRLKNLKVLSLQNNRVDSLPVELSDLTRLETLDLGGNPLESPPPEVVAKGADGIRNYLLQLGKEGRDYLYEAKLLIVGEAGAGKTSLAKKIENADYELREDQGSTMGIDIIEWHFAMDGSQDFRVNIWDFGGQQIYHATHQFFLTKRSLYALVADERKEDTDFDYWLNVVELLSDSSPILIIQNEKKDRHREINESALRGQFGNIKEILATNLATNRGLHKVCKAVRYHLSGLPHVGTELPRTWVKVREALEKEDRNYISLEEYFDICENNGFRLEKDKLQLSGYLHDLGVCLHFQNDLLLKKTVILKPEWGTDAVYKVLDDDGVIKTKGRFTQADVARIWDESQYANMHLELLRLMINFKLCYSIKGGGEYIAPQLLAKNQPAYKWNEKDNLIMRYTYEFMPKGIVTQFIVAVHPLIADQELVWREGAILKKDETQAEVIENYGKREIKIRVAGRHKKELITIVAYELDRIHSGYTRLKRDKWVPCNCEGCKGNPEPHFYSFDTLREFSAGGQDVIQCQKKPYKMVSVRRLIDDVVSRKVRGQGRKRFRVALSFPGEQRDFAEKVADFLGEQFGEDEVFYDKHFEAELARPNADTLVQDIYHDGSELIVVFLCAGYKKKEWCGLEWRAIRDLIKKRKESDIMFIRFDDTPILGSYSIDGYVDARDRTEREVAELIVRRYQMNQQNEDR